VAAVDKLLPPIRIGHPYSVEIDYPGGFLVAGESVRTKLRRYIGDTSPVVPTDSRAGDTVTWELSAAQTAALEPAQFYAEAEIYVEASPADPGTFLTDNRYIIRCTHSPSE
jgi:hypothetical protein